MTPCTKRSIVIRFLMLFFLQTRWSFLFSCTSMKCCSSGLQSNSSFWFFFFFESNVNFYVRGKRGVLNILMHAKVLNVLLLFNMTDNEVLPQKHIYSTKILSNTRMVWQSNTKLYEKLMFYKSLYPMHQLILLRYRYLYILFV